MSEQQFFTYINTSSYPPVKEPFFNRFLPGQFKMGNQGQFDRGLHLLDSSSKLALAAAVTAAKRERRSIRFWGAPDLPAAWSVLQKLGVGYINTDKISELAAFLK